MNCKPGDLAVFVRSDAGNEGKVVRCLRVATKRELKAQNFVSNCGPVWLIDQLVNTNCGLLCPLVLDQYLRPIRDPGDDAKDETLLWKPTPKEGEISEEEADLLLEALRQRAKEQA